MAEGDERGAAGVTTEEARAVHLEVDAAYPRDALYAAACTFTDRCFVKLEVGPEREGSRVRVVLRAKEGRAFDGPNLLEELRGELEGQSFRQRMVEGSRDFLREVYGGAAVGETPKPSPRAVALGDTPKPPPPAIVVDDLRSFEEGPDDPLALAMQWEAKREGKAP